MGDAISVLTANDPALSPKMVTFSGSPPNFAMLPFTQWSARDHVHQAVVPCRPAALLRQFFGVQKTKYTEAVVDGDQHHALRGRKSPLWRGSTPEPPDSRRHESRT